MQTPTLPRRRFFRLTLFSAGSLFLLATIRGRAEPPAPQIAPRNAEPLAEELVHEFVWRAHFDLEGVRRMLTEQPGLLNATYDWGRGDFESALGGAGHMGRRDISEFLLSQGARADLFVAAMLGRLDLVQAYLVMTPSLLHSAGPHGIPLLRHALAGGTAASAVADFLRAAGAR